MTKTDIKTYLRIGPPGFKVGQKVQWRFRDKVEFIIEKIEPYETKNVPVNYIYVMKRCDEFSDGRQLYECWEHEIQAV